MIGWQRELPKRGGGIAPHRPDVEGPVRLDCEVGPWLKSELQEFCSSDGFPRLRDYSDLSVLP